MKSRWHDQCPKPNLVKVIIKNNYNGLAKRSPNWNIAFRKIAYLCAYFFLEICCNSYSNPFQAFLRTRGRPLCSSFWTKSTWRPSCQEKGHSRSLLRPTRPLRSSTPTWCPLWIRWLNRVYMRDFCLRFCTGIHYDSKGFQKRILKRLFPLIFIGQGAA